MKTLKLLSLSLYTFAVITTASAQSSHSGGIGYFMVGVSSINNSKAQTLLQNPTLLGNGFSFNSPGLMFGGRGFGVFNRFLLGGGGYSSTVSGVSNIGEVDMHIGGGFFNVGYIIKQNTSNNFYAFGGFGGGGTSIKITNTSNAPIQFNNNQVVPAGENRTISSSGTSFEFGVGFNQFIIRGKDKSASSGFLVGLIAGINYSPIRKWEFESNKTAVAGLGNTSSIYIGITIGGGSIRQD